MKTDESISIQQQLYEIKEIITNLSKYYGFVIKGNIEFYNDIIAIEYILDYKNKDFYPKFIATTDKLYVNT